MIIIDLGQSGARAEIDGKIYELSRGKLAGESVLDSIRAVAALLPPLQTDVAALSLTGLFGFVEDPAPFHDLTSTLWSVSHTAVIDDGLASYFGALGGEDGVALTLGGGVVAVGGCNGIYSHADGLGSIFGDEGSGYWLGVRGLTRALAVVDSREGDDGIYQQLEAEVKAFDALAVKNSSEAVSLAIHTAAKVLAAADSGIASAISIRAEAAMRLGNTVVAAWRKAGGELSGTPVIAISGGLSKNESYVKEILGHVSNQIPASRSISPVGNNLSGARWIAENIAHDVEPLMKWARS